MRRNIVLIICLLAPSLAFSQIEDLSKSKIIFSVNNLNPYILMDDTLKVTNGNIFVTDTGRHTAKIWAPKHDVLDTSFVIKNGVHLNRQFFDLKKREDFIKRRNNDIIVATVLGVSAPILLAIDTDFEPFDEAPYQAEIAKWEAQAASGDQIAQQNLITARENLKFVQDQNDEEKRKVDTRKAIVTGVLITELVGVTAYIISRALGPKLKVENPLLSDLQISPQVGMNSAGIGLGFKF